MKILLVNDIGVSIGGAEQMIVTLKEDLQTRGIDARIFASTAHVRGNSSFADFNCHGSTSKLRTLNRVINFSACLKLREVIKQFKPDVVQVRMFLTQLSPMILPVLRRVPTLYHAPWYESICPTGLKLLPNYTICKEKAGLACRRNGCLSRRAWGPLMLQLKLFQRWRSAFNMIIANSYAVQRHLLNDGIHPVEVVYNGVPIRPRRPSLSSPPTVSYAGRFSWEKGVDVLLQAFAKVVCQIPTARLLLAGDGPDMERIQQLIADLNLKTHVSTLGFLPQQELELRLSQAWAHAVPSRLAEPFGLAAAEAMMRGTAVVATNAGGLAEIVCDGKTGFLVPPSDIDAMAKAIIHLLRNRGQTEEMGAIGRERAMKLFSNKICVEKLITIYRTLCKTAEIR